VALLGLALLLWFLWPFLAHGHRFPLGPDGPVYLWWERLAGEEGLSVVGGRPGVPALALVLQGALGRTEVESTVALQVALGVAAGLAAAALLHGRTSRVGWILAGVLAGTFGVHLAAGYLANLLQVATFLAAAAALAMGTRRGAGVAAGLLAAGGLAHPLFFLLSAAVLLLAAALAWRADRSEALRVGAAVAGAGAAVGAGLLALLSGPPPSTADTSKDAFLRRAGLLDELRHAYRDRFVHRWTRYVQWASIPLGVLGLGGTGGFVGRFLRAWGLVTIVGAAAAFATGLLPADRFVTFGFVVPILAALGIVRLLERLAARRLVASLSAGALVVVMLAGAFIAWNRQEPFLSEDEVEQARIAGVLAGDLDAGVPLGFLVNEPDDAVTFLASRAANVIRAVVPPDRIRDVIVVVPPLETGETGVQRSALERLTAADLREAERRSGRPAAMFVLRAFDAIDAPEDATVIPGSTYPTRVFGGTFGSSPAGIVGSSALALAFLVVVGLGWAWVAVDDLVQAVTIAPAAGASALVVVAIALERLGVVLDGAGGAWLVSALAGGSGLVVRLVLQRRAA
jgi:hypothetical protein